MSLDLENHQRLLIFDDCSPNIVFFVVLLGVQLRFELSLHVQNSLHFAKFEEISKKLDDKKKRVPESFDANLPPGGNLTGWEFTGGI